MSTFQGAGPARIAWGYRTAAALGAWKITVARGETPGAFSRTLTAELQDADIQALRQRPLTFVVLREGRPNLTWPVVSLQIGINAVTGELGAKEDVHHVVAIRASGN
jgi:hypothetical protein